MASVLQALFSLPAFQKRYNDLARAHSRACTVPLPAECVECQMHKVADGLLSGRYSHPANYSGNVTPAADPLQHASPTPVFQTGVRPMGFKSLIGKGHEEFATMKQQDSEEFFIHLLTVLRRDMHKHKDRSDQGSSYPRCFCQRPADQSGRPYNRLLIRSRTASAVQRLQESAL